jgi:hypothetical protein
MGLKMKIYIGLDDTDNLDCDHGTGKIARWLGNELPAGCRVWGVVRQQLLVDDAIPYTSHNSSACLIVESSRNGDLLQELTERSVKHLERHAVAGSDPGLCVAAEGGPDLGDLIAFGLSCTRSVMSQKEARLACQGVHLSGHGGSNDGIIGAAAAVGLTAAGWYGRFIEFGLLRRLPSELRVVELEGLGIRVMAMDRDAFVPKPGDRVLTQNWVRPRLLGGQPVLPVAPQTPGTWQTMGGRRGRKNGGHEVSGI